MNLVWQIIKILARTEMRWGNISFSLISFICKLGVIFFAYVHRMMNRTITCEFTNCSGKSKGKALYYKSVMLNQGGEVGGRGVVVSHLGF